MEDIAKNNIEEALENSLKFIKTNFTQNILKRSNPNQTKKGIPWIETLDITSKNKIHLISSQINDDIQREVLFYNLTIENVKAGLKKIHENHISIIRPNDYLTEMYKSDEMMQKIRNHLVRQQIKIKNYQERKQKRENKKFAKKLQKQKELEKIKEKKKNLAAINKWKEQIKNKGDSAPDLDEFINNDKKKSKGMKGTKDHRFKRENQISQGKRKNFGMKNNNFKEKAKSFNKKANFGDKNPRSKKIKKTPKNGNRPGKNSKKIMKRKFKK